MTPRCAAATVVSAVVLRRPTKEYTHRYSIMHRRLTTAGNEIAPHYHQLLVYRGGGLLVEQLCVYVPGAGGALYAPVVCGCSVAIKYLCCCQEEI